LEIWHRTKTCIEGLTEELKNNSDYSFDLSIARLEGIGITNQRETTIAWNAKTGKPYYNAIVWDDVRTSSIAQTLTKDGGIDRFRKQTGLPLASYFAGTKVRWLIDNVPELQKDLQDEAKKNDVRFGTIDTWLMYQLTGKPTQQNGSANAGGIHVTDVGNASRWLLMDLDKVAWDTNLVRQICNLDIPLSCFPEICPSSHVYGQISDSVPVLKGKPLAAILGDQQSALFGQCALNAGEAKNTYGTGMFLMMNTGKKIVPSKSGLLTTVAYKIGKCQFRHNLKSFSTILFVWKGRIGGELNQLCHQYTCKQYCRRRWPSPLCLGG
jgi:glycerol kinase